MTATAEPNAATTTHDGRTYTDPTTGESYPSVTTVLKATSSKPGLIKWAASSAAEYAVDHLDVVRQLVEAGEREAALELIRKAPDRKKESGGDRGSTLHHVAEALVLDSPLPAVPPELQGYADALLAFMVEHDVTFEAAELAVVSTVHRYAGTLDAIVRPGVGELAGLRLDLDWKTAPRLYTDEVSPQLAAYHRADEAWLFARDGRFIGKEPKPRTDGALAILLAADGTYRVHKVDVGDAVFDGFLHALALYRSQPALRGADLGRVFAPGQTVPVADVASLGRCRGALEAAGIVTLDDLVGWTTEQLAALPGIGPKAVESIAAAIERFTAPAAAAS